MSQLTLYNAVLRTVEIRREHGMGEAEDGAQRELSTLRSRATAEDGRPSELCPSVGPSSTSPHSYPSVLSAPVRKFVFGSTGHWPVPPGDSPGGTGSAPGGNKDTRCASGNLALPVGESSRKLSGAGRPCYPFSGRALPVCPGAGRRRFISRQPWRRRRGRCA